MTDGVQKSGIATVLVPVPTLSDLKSRPCSLEELQAALVAFIELYNKQSKAVDEALDRKVNRPWQATI